ncbi:MAG: DUF4292 domain-containing protein [Spirosomaceae bacterium]|nr:DUF4292 domain-containing protein [Spirosomataceae bacterium]
MVFKVLKWAAIISIIAFQTSCKRHKLKKSEVFVPGKNKADSTVIITEKAPVSEPIIIAQPDELDFNYLKIKSKVAFSSPDFSQTFPATIQVKKDSIIWVSVAVGLEVARGIITPDSAIFLDRLNRNVYQFGYQELSEFMGFNISFDLVQALLVGNMPIYVRDEDVVTENGGFITVKQNVGELEVENTIDAFKNKLTRVLAQRANAPNRLVITYADFTKTENGEIPQRIETRVEKLAVETETTTSINIEHNKFEFLERDLRFPFSVPKSYTPVSLKK